MILIELTGSEQHPVYKYLEVSNGDRQYDFLRSLVVAAIALNKPLLSQTVIKSFNFLAIGCLHTNAGEYRPCPVYVGTYVPPEHYRVQALMDDFVNEVNRRWDALNAITLASYVLWRLNLIHPFINGNGRTARAACYYVLCLKLGGLLRGSPILPELLKLNRDEYVRCLQLVDVSAQAGALNLGPLDDLLMRLLAEQLASTEASATAPPPITPSFLALAPP